MKDSTFTPGPWKVDLDFELTDDNYHSILANGGPHFHEPGFRITGVINIHDAELIAKAPEMYEALKQCKGALNSIQGAEAWISDSKIKSIWQQKIYPAMETINKLGL